MLAKYMSLLKLTSNCMKANHKTLDISSFHATGLFLQRGFYSSEIVTSFGMDYILFRMEIIYYVEVWISLVGNPYRRFS